MVDSSTVAKLLQSFKIAVNAHDRENPDHNTWGIGMSHFDIERLDFDEGEEILPGIVLRNDGGTTGNFRILCDGEHDADEEVEEEEVVDAVAEEARVGAGPAEYEYDDELVELPAPLRPPV
jgi:hypothetical protein